MNDIDVLEQHAVDAAMNSQWKDAINLNEQILHVDSKNLSACLRLGFTYLQLKNNKDAKKYYQKALRIQPKNQVALENLEKLKILGDKNTKKHTDTTALDPNLFLEIPGKTRTVILVNIGQKKDIAELTAGQEVELKSKKRKVEARTKGGNYIGCLPDDLSKRLIFFLKAKSKYVAYVKEASSNRVVIFIKEELKGKKVSHFLSFPQNIQTNMEQITDESENDEEVEGEEEWDALTTPDLVPEEKEEIVDIHPEEEDVEE